MKDEKKKHPEPKVRPAGIPADATWDEDEGFYRDAEGNPIGPGSGGGEPPTNPGGGSGGG